MSCFSAKRCFSIVRSRLSWSSYCCWVITGAGLAASEDTEVELSMGGAGDVEEAMEGRGGRGMAGGGDGRVVTEVDLRT